MIVSIEAMKQAAQDAAEAIDWLLKNIRLDAPQLSGKAMGNAEKCASALRAALAQQPITATACGIPGMAKTTCPYCEQGFAFEHEQPAAPEPVKSFAELREKHRAGIDAERAKLDATGEPVGYMNEGHIHELAMRRIPYGYVYPEAGAGASTAVYTRPAPSAPKDDQIATLVNKVRDIARMFHDHRSLRERIAIELVPALKVSQEVKSNAERGRFMVGWLKRFGLLQSEFGQIGAGEKPENWWMLHAPWGIDKTRPFFGHGKTPEQAIDDAMLAAKEQKGQG